MGPRRPNNSNNRKPVSTGGRMTGRCTNPSSASLPEKRRDRRKAMAMAGGSDSSTAQNATAKLVDRTWISTADSIHVRVQHQHVHQRTLFERRRVRPAGGSGHWRRQKWKCAKNPGLQRPAPSDAPGHPPRRGPADNARAAHCQAAPGQAGTLKFNRGRRIAAQHPVENGFEEQPRTDQRRSGISRKAQHEPVATAAKPGRLAGPHRDLCPPKFQAQAASGPAAPGHDRPTDAPPTSTSKSLPRKPLLRRARDGSAHRLFPRPDGRAHRPSLSTRPARPKVAESKICHGPGVVPGGASSSPLDRIATRGLAATGYFRKPRRRSQRKRNAIELAPCIQQQLCRQ